MLIFIPIEQRLRCNYQSPWNSSKSYSQLNYLVFRLLWRWAKRRHPNKSAHWRVSKYWRTVGGDRWYFATTIENKIMRLFKYRKTPIRWHIKAYNRLRWKRYV